MDTLIGIILLFTALGVVLVFVLWGNKTIDFIYRKRLQSARQIVKKLNEKKHQ